ncbi:MAG: RNA-binding protein [Pelovirga sp.]
MKERHNYKDIFVSELSYETTEEDLHKLFSLCGTVRSINMLTSAQGQFRGIAFVRMGNEKETRDAIATLDGTRLINRCISVSEAKSREERDEPVEVSTAKARRRRLPVGRRKVR